MKIKIGLGNQMSTTFNPAAKTLSVIGAYNFDIEPQNLEVYDSSLSAWVYGGDSTATILAVSGYDDQFVQRVYQPGSLPLQTVQFSAVPSGAASGDTLQVFCEVPDDVAIYNALVHILP